jgi:acetate kinase
MVNTLGYSLAVNNLLLKESGMLGLTGFSDLREIELQAEEGMHRQLALDMNAYRIKKNHRFLYGSDEWPRRYYFTAGIGRILLISGN